jgi:hypothetical protein
MPVPTIGNISLPETKKSHPASRAHQPLKGGVSGVGETMTFGDLSPDVFDEETPSSNDVVSTVRDFVHEQPLVVVALSAVFGFIAASLFARR